MACIRKFFLTGIICSLLSWTQSRNIFAKIKSEHLREKVEKVQEFLPTSLPKRLVDSVQDLQFKDMPLKDLINYEVVYPEKLNYTEAVFEEFSDVSGRKSKRKRRHVPELTETYASFYKINAFGNSYMLRLHKEFTMSPHWVSVEYYKENGDYQKKLVNGDCYKAGDVVGANGTHMAAVSDCKGLTGVIQIPDDFLYIEPISGNQADNSSSRAHIIYRLSNLQGYLRNDSSNLLEDFLPARKLDLWRIFTRRKRDAYDSFVTFISRAPAEVQIFWIDYRGRKNYFLTLRPNEQRGVNTYDRTKWIAVDKSGKIRLLIQGKQEYFTRSNDESERTKLYVTAPAGVQFPEDARQNEVSGDEKYIEVMVIADYSVTKHHGRRDVEKYILTFMNIVSRIFKDASLGVRINFVVTRIAVLERHEPSLQIISNSPSKSVTSACNFATTLQRGNDGDKDHFDFALILTKRKFGPSGYAPVYSMCTKTRSCALVEDDGFTSAFIAAHETGHTLGLEHDGQGGNDCSHDGGKGSVMAALVVSRFDRFYWSKCSRSTIKENIEYFQCLNDKPQAAKMRYFTLPPGAYYTLDDQCESNFSPGYSRCTAFSYNPCRLIWCNMPGKARYCKTLRGPALDGSTCGRNMWCSRGSCVPSDIPITPRMPTTLPPIHGNWGRWSSWSSCSSTCGLGVRHRQRKCDDPKPLRGGKQCLGSAVEKDICDQRDCILVKSFDDSREDQCKLFGGKGWRLYRDSIFQRLLNQARSNINCTFEKGMCNWINMKAGDDFDWKLNRGRTPSSDTGPSTDHTKRNDKGQYVFIEASDDYKERRRRYDKALLVSAMVRVPRTCFRFHYHMYGKDMGELKINVQVIGETRKQLFHKRGNQGSRWINGEVSLEVKKPFRIVIEAIRGRHYTGDIAIDDVSLTAGLCPKDEQARSACVVSCRSSGANEFILDRQVLDGTKCHSNRSSDICIKGKCEPFGCDKVFGSNKVVDDCGVCGGDGSTCRKVSGHKEIKPRRDFEIVLILMPGMTNLKLQDDNVNPYQLGIRRKNSRGLYLTDHRGAANGYYQVGSSTFRYGLVSGKRFISSDGPIKEELEAVLYSPQIYRVSGKTSRLQYEYFRINSNKNEAFKYQFKGYSRCSKSCGIGKRVSNLQCVRQKDNKVMPVKYCSHLIKPKRYQACNLHPCPEKYKWIIMPWGQCSASCNGGNRSRVIACMKVRGNQVASNRLCPSPVPPNREECNTHPCDVYEWQRGPWGLCSKTCGGGVKRRRVTCMGLNKKEKVDSALCVDDQPKDRQACNIFMCDVFEWTTLKFGVCSKSCGGGFRIRLVYCVNKKSNGRVPPALCTGPSPERIGRCNAQPCPEYLWKVGEYSNCSRSCGNGTRSRSVHCVQADIGKVVGQENCKTKKPETVIPCYNTVCDRYVWNTEQWSECLALCGQGVKTRTVKCVNDKTGKAVANTFCKGKKPYTKKGCSVKPCALPADLNCNFDESSKFGNWRNANDDNFDWQIGQFTPSSGTGPMSDHTTGKSGGRFAYIEASNPQSYGDKARIVGPLMKCQEGCLQFWYHMKGRSMGTLLVEVSDSRNSKMVFEKKGHQGDNWIQARVPIKRQNPTVPYKISFTGIRGQTYASDIALDDISMQCKPCVKNRSFDPLKRKVSWCREVSPLCVLAQTGDYCKYRSFRQLCCQTCAV